MTNNTNQKRQPKGTETGGQFAPDVNAESTVLLAPEPLMQMVMVAPPTIAEREASIKSLETEIGELEVSLQEAYLDEAIDDVSDYEESLLSGNRRLVGAQRELIEALREGPSSFDLGAAVTSRANTSGRLQGLTSCAYAVDEAIATLTRWDGGSGADPADVLAHLIEVREEIFAAASPELVGQWRDLESNIRGFESDPDSSPLDDDGYEVARDDRETVFRSIYEEAFAS